MSDQFRSVLRYYRTSESRIGYHLILGGTRHFGWYPDRGLSRWRFNKAHHNMEEVLGRRLNLDAGMKILDAGCGEGNVARTIASEWGVNVVGIDLVPESIEIARRKSLRQNLADRTVFSEGDYHSLQFEDQSFDRVYTMETFVHARDCLSVLKEFHRVLKPGGRLVMFEYSSTPLNQLTAEAGAALVRVCELAAMPGWLELVHGRLPEIALEAGFQTKSVEDITQNMMPMLRAFATIARVPYWILCKLGKESKAVNAMSAVEMHRFQEAWRYNVYVLDRPH